MTDITVLDKPVEIQTYVPPTPRNIGLRMQYQETTEWCWMAVATSVSHFYNPASTWTQCQVMTVVGHNVNGFPADTSACPSAATLAAHPELGPILANAYDQKAEFVLNNPAYGIDARYIKSGGVSDPLKVTGNLGSIQSSNLSLAQIAAEVNAGRPVIAAITWFSGGSHFVAIAGVDGDNMLILDPITASWSCALARSPAPTSAAQSRTSTSSPRRPEPAARTLKTSGLRQRSGSLFFAPTRRIVSSGRQVL